MHSVLVTMRHLPLSMKLPLANSKVVRIAKEKVKHLHVFLSMRLGSIAKCANYFFRRFYMFFQSNPLLLQLIYFMSTSFAGFLALKNLKPQHKPTPRNLDLIFTSVSTLTVSSMATVEMEDFSDQQLWVLILQMLLGGEIFTSMLGLLFNNARANTDNILQKRLPSTCRDIDFSDAVNRSYQNNIGDIHSEATVSHNQVSESKGVNQYFCSILAYVVAGYFVAGIVCSSLVVIIYIWTDSDAKYLLKSKNIKIWTFSIFTAVSSFANCGFTPINDNMAIFRKNSGLLLLVIPQILAGNTLFAPLLRLSIWALGKISKREEYAYILQHPEETGYRHLQRQKNAVNLVLTAVGIILLQVMFLCYFGWDSKPFEGLNWFQKLVCSLFQSVNTRHAGEAVIDISILSPPILVLFALVMYFPSDNSSDDQISTDKRENSNSRPLWKNFNISQPAWLAAFIIFACITERRSMSLDPLNFNIFSIVFEVVSAYGNVGYSLGYSCERLLKPDADCKAVSYGFVGRWTDEGKLIIILVMILGRLKKFSLKGGEP
ncbi:cation transporter HKT1;1-like [Phragmites australis]|uniref:cation transporter HKT1;1-like n=1 Tax=Phragmites australis TaxID=29695 RepID=UPI002D769412|nr:cation transporter HKT1;1-like [Phragmites australis]